MSHELNKMRFDIEMIRSFIDGAYFQADGKSAATLKQIYDEISDFIDNYFEKLGENK